MLVLLLVSPFQVSAASNDFSLLQGNGSRESWELTQKAGAFSPEQYVFSSTLHHGSEAFLQESSHALVSFFGSKILRDGILHLSISVERGESIIQTHGYGTIEIGGRSHSFTVDVY
jgi:hypothetical protein